MDSYRNRQIIDCGVKGVANCGIHVVKGVADCGIHVVKGVAVGRFEQLLKLCTSVNTSLDIPQENKKIRYCATPIKA